jgi:hypothetical protein
MSATPQVKALSCPSCGAPLTIRGMAHTLTVVCENCHSILDAKDPNFQVLQKFEARQRIHPRIPLGTRGQLAGATYEVIGFQVRTITVDGTDYSWSEYLLFNPYKGFRYLTEYEGHWNHVTVLRQLPEVSTSHRPSARIFGDTFRHFQTAVARTTYVLGEFPWQVRVGEQATAMDFISPPRMLSAETTPEETVWSLGDYVSGADLWRAFKLPDRPPRPVGVFANQPSPYKGRVGTAWVLFLFLTVALIALGIMTAGLSADQRVFESSYSFWPGGGGEPSFTTRVFELGGRPSNVELSIHTDLSNNWAYFHFALINADTGQAVDFGREVSYYFGRDSDGAWTEGGRNDTAYIPTVPAGRYYLLVEPEMDKKAAPMRYSLELRRDVPNMGFFAGAFALLLIPPFVAVFRSFAFEKRRWAESDYAPSGDDD